MLLLLDVCYSISRIGPAAIQKRNGKKIDSDQMSPGKRETETDATRNNNMEWLIRDAEHVSI